MAELTDREQKIVIMKQIMDGKQYEKVPIETRSQMVYATLKTMGLDFTGEEIQDLGEAIGEVQKRSYDSLIGFLHTNKELVAESIDSISKKGSKWRF